MRRTVRLKENLVARIDEAAKSRGYATTSAFIRAAIEAELAGRGAEITAAEERIAGSFDRLTHDLRRLNTGQQALFAFVDALAKTILTCVPEPAGEAYSQAVARGKLRYERFLKSVGAGMVGESNTALAQLVDHGEG